MPVEVTTLAAFIAASLAIVLSPGPDTMLILRYTMTSGQRTGLATVTGVQLGLIVHTVAAAVGLSLIIASSDLLFRAIAIAGAAYLAWLGLQGFRAGLLNVAAMTAGGSVSAAKALRDAMLTNILNPKVILLFLALMPNFVAADRGQVPLQLAVLGHRADRRQHGVADRPCRRRGTGTALAWTPGDSTGRVARHGRRPARIRGTPSRRTRPLGGRLVALRVDQYLR